MNHPAFDDSHLPVDIHDECTSFTLRNTETPKSLLQQAKPILQVFPFTKGSQSLAPLSKIASFSHYPPWVHDHDIHINHLPLPVNPSYFQAKAAQAKPPNQLFSGQGSELPYASPSSNQSSKPRCSLL